MATTSQKIMLIKFLVVMRGARTPAPRIDDPVMKIPQAAPITLRPIHRPIPVLAHTYGLVCSRKVPTANWSPEPDMSNQTRTSQNKVSSAIERKSKERAKRRVGNHTHAGKRRLVHWLSIWRSRRVAPVLSKHISCGEHARKGSINELYTE